MTAEEIMKLVNAGFTKSDILALTGANNQTQPIQAPAKAEPKKEEPKQESTEPVKQDDSKNTQIQPAGTKVENNIVLSKEDLLGVLQSMALQNTTVDIPKSKSSEDFLNERFMGLLGGSKENGGNENGK